VTLIKTVVNDDGGTLSEGAFHPCIEGLPASWAKPVPLAAGTHTLTKTVVNDNGGTLTRGDFEPYLDGESALWGMSIPLSPGSHTVTETQAPDYTASDWAGACEPDGTLAVEAGGIYTCSIVNDDYASTFVYLPLVERQ
jgi:hypothetical protein